MTKMFVGEVVFIDQDGAAGIERAMVAEREFRAAGFLTNITADVDPYSNAAWLVIARPSEVELRDEVQNIAKEFGGDFDECGLIDSLNAFWHERLCNPWSER
jgi:hypothetical protein